MENTYTVQEKRILSASAFVLRFDRNNMQFKAGQYLSVGLENESQARDYSIYSTEFDPFLEILVKEIKDGIVSNQLHQCKRGDLLRIAGPKGTFLLNAEKMYTHKHLFVATGTGISPFHSHIKSHPRLDYQLVHGVSCAQDAYEKSDYNKKRYILCTSKEKTGNFHGRTTDYLKTQTFDKNTLCYLCGNGDMIFEVFEILTSRGIPIENIHTEIYY